MKNADRFVVIRLTRAIAESCGLPSSGPLWTEWTVPRGFGRAFLRHAAELAPPDVLRDRLELVGWTAKPEAIASWPIYRRVEADVYACAVHLRAGDNPVPVPPRPHWFPPEPWRGPPLDLSRIREDLRGAFEGPSPTPIVGASVKGRSHAD